MDNSFEAEFFSDARVERVEVKILNDLWQNLHDEFAINEWTAEDGLHYTLAAGWAALRAERQREQLDHLAADLPAEIERQRAERIQLEGRYAVMRYRTYQFMQAAKILEMKLNACRAELDMLRKANEKLRAKPN